MKRRIFAGFSLHADVVGGVADAGASRGVAVCVTGGVGVCTAEGARCTGKFVTSAGAVVVGESGVVIAGDVVVVTEC